MKKTIYLWGMLLGMVFLSGCIEFRHEIYAHSGAEDYDIKTQKDAYTLQDGTVISRWEPDEESKEHSYRLQDGQELLAVELPDAVDEGSVHGMEGMEPEALQAALAYFETQGLQPRIPALLEDAYADYTKCTEDGTRFLPHFAGQETEPCVETDRFTGFVTVTEIAAGTESVKTSRVVLFDRSTGDIIPPEDLFTVSKEEAVRILAERCVEERPSVDLETMKSLISPERIQWMQEWVGIIFEKGELPGADEDAGGEASGMDEDTGYEFRISYEEIEEYLQPWAVPDAESGEEKE